MIKSQVCCIIDTVYSPLACDAGCTWARHNLCKQPNNTWVLEKLLLTLTSASAAAKFLDKAGVKG